QASADGFDNTTALITVHSDTTVILVLEPSALPAVLLIDYDSGITPFFDGSDSIGEDVIVEGLLESTGYSYVKTGQNPNIDTLRLSDYEYVVLITPVRTGGSHAIIPNGALDDLAAWLADDGRLLWIAPDAGPDYAYGSSSASNFFDLFGSVYESDGRPSEPTGNVASLIGEPRWFFMAVNASYALNSPADNYLDEFSPADSNTYIALASQDSAPAPIADVGRVMFRDLPEYRAVLSSVLFGGMEDGFFPNNKQTIFRACMDFLSKEYDVPEVPPKPRYESISVYPNPFNSSVRIDGLTPGDGALEIFDVSGRVVARLEARGATAEWSPDESVGSGLYLIRESATGRTSRAIYLR
ncbi:T9SS type A sorting domain-containing protein, partial [bacterium]|nr:T9SS type A sorting domain-containing protein [bacterium]